MPSSFLFFKDESNYSTGTDEHRRSVEYALKCYKKISETVVIVAGENCTVNISFSTKTSIPLVACASHKLQLAIKGQI